MIEIASDGQVGIEDLKKIFYDYHTGNDTKLRERAAQNMARQIRDESLLFTRKLQALREANPVLDHAINDALGSISPRMTFG